MSKEIVINSDSESTRIAIVENGELAELFIETDEYERTIGNLYLGRVRRIMPAIQAAFVDIGQKQDAFLHFSDLTEALPDWLEFIQGDRPRISEFHPGHVHKNKGRKRRRPVHARSRKRLEDGADDPEDEMPDDGEGDGKRSHGSVVGSRTSGRRRAGRKGGNDGRADHEAPQPANDHPTGPPLDMLLKRDQQILVKISKEPIAQKGSRITTDISLAGRFLVLVPMASYVAVSKKVSSFKERRRLRALANSLLPEGFAVIVRTVAEGQNAKALDMDLRLLLEKWADIEKRLIDKPKPPAPVYEDVNMVSSIMRDLFSQDYDRILIDNPKTFRNLKGYVQAIAPSMAKDVVLHEGKTPVFQAANIDREVAEAFRSRVNLPSGGYLFIEQTEAMHVVDVNSGRAGRGLSQEENSLRVDLESAKVIAKQIRLRDLGGIIVIDFIDLRDERNRRKVYDALRKEFRQDRAVTKLLPMSDFGLIQITRQRLRPSITTTFAGPDDDLDEGEYVEPVATAALPLKSRTVTPEELTNRVDDWLAAFKAAKWKGGLRLRVHPFAASYLSSGLLSFTVRCALRFRLRVRLEEHEGTEPGRFRFFDQINGKEIRRPPRRGKKRLEEKQKSAAEPRRQAKKTDGESEKETKRGRRSGRPESNTETRDRRSGSGSSTKDSSGSSRERGRGRKESTQRSGRGRGPANDSTTDAGTDSQAPSRRRPAPKAPEKKSTRASSESGEGGERSSRRGRGTRGGRGRGKAREPDTQNPESALIAPLPTDTRNQNPETASVANTSSESNKAETPKKAVPARAARTARKPREKAAPDSATTEPKPRAKRAPRRKAGDEAAAALAAGDQLADTPADTTADTAAERVPETATTAAADSPRTKSAPAAIDETAGTGVAEVGIGGDLAEAAPAAANEVKPRAKRAPRAPRAKKAPSKPSPESTDSADAATGSASTFTAESAPEPSAAAPAAEAGPKPSSGPKRTPRFAMIDLRTKPKPARRETNEEGDGSDGSSDD